MTNCYDQPYAEGFSYEQSIYNLLKTLIKAFKFLKEWKEIVIIFFLLQSQYMLIVENLGNTDASFSQK